MRSAWVALLAVVLAVGCGTAVFEHDALGLGRGDGGGLDASAAIDAATAVFDCAALDEGAACDDRDICTPRSVCEQGECVGENPFDDCVVADTVADFSDTQGQDGWHYGYWDAEHDPNGRYDPESDFQPMVQCSGTQWMPPGCADPNDPDRNWTSNLSHGLQHPEVRPFLQIPVRRWVSDVSGPARVRIEHSQPEDHAGDGTRALLYLDGVEVWRHETGDVVSAGEATVDVTLEQGALLEQLLHPRSNQADDTSYFALTVAP